MNQSNSPLGKDLVGLESLSAEQILTILNTAEPFKEISERRIKKVPVLRGKHNREPLLRGIHPHPGIVRIRREATERGHGEHCVERVLGGQGGDLVDTARNLEAMRIDMVVIRHGSSGAAKFLAERIPSNVINAGDGSHEHPTQALLDILTIRDHYGKIEGLRVCLVGDILHSRVARSNIFGLLALGAEVAVCGPKTLLPLGIADLGITVFSRIEEAIQWADVLNVLRLQLERMEAGFLPQLARVQSGLGRLPGQARAGAEGLVGPPSRAHEPRGRDRQRRRGRAPRHDSAAGDERCRSPDGGPLSARWGCARHGRGGQGRSGGLSSPLLIRGGRVIDPSQSIDAVQDVLVKDGVIAEVGKGIDPPKRAREIDAGGLVVTPGLIDVHVHLREPGGEHKETIVTGAMAAAAGGFTAVCAMPNTDPVVDDPAGVGFVLAQGLAAGAARVYPMGAISVGQEGKQLAAIGEMYEAGAVGITDDGNPVMDSGLMRKALEYAQAFDIPVADHPEDLGLSGAGVMNEGLVATKLGLHGKPNAAEDVHIVRDLLLAELTEGHIHLQHVSTAYGMEAIRQAKARGVRVTAEASPHHLILTDERVEGFDTDAKMNPPLRSLEDREAVREGLADGTLDVFATDHAPHHYDEKEQALRRRTQRDHRVGDGVGARAYICGRGGTHRPSDAHPSDECRSGSGVRLARRNVGRRLAR